MLMITCHWYSSIYAWYNLHYQTAYNKFEGLKVEKPKAYNLLISGHQIGFMILSKHIPKSLICISYIWIRPRYLNNQELLKDIANCAVATAFENGYDEVFVEVDDRIVFEKAGFREVEKRLT